MASRIASRYFTTILGAPRTISPSFLRPYPRLPRTLQPFAPRFAHAIPRPTRTKQEEQTTTEPAAPRKELEPHYQLTFTCVPCTNRSTHVISKQGYHRGSVLITCPSCRNRHVISDNLNIFGDRKITVEDLLREKGQLVKRGTLGEDGDIEFWEDAAAADPPRAGGASTVSKGEGDGERAEAETLRETRNPSFQTTDPTPSASLLPGDAGSRPSVRGPSHQTTTPSTRRQYHIKKFQPPTGLKARAMKPLDQTRPLSDSEVNLSPVFSKPGNSHTGPKPVDLTNHSRASSPDWPTGKHTDSHRGARSITEAEEERNSWKFKPRKEKVLEPWQQKMLKRKLRKEKKKERDSAPSEPAVNQSTNSFYGPRPPIVEDIDLSKNEITKENIRGRQQEKKIEKLVRREQRRQEKIEKRELQLEKRRERNISRKREQQEKDGEITIRRSRPSGWGNGWELERLKAIMAAASDHDDSAPAPAPPIRHVAGREREVMAEPEFRRAFFEPEFRGLRFIENESDDKKIRVQLRPGVVTYRRPPGGEMREISEQPAAPEPKAWRSLTQQYGYFRPQGVSPSLPSRE
ncbi:DNL zinc finger-domain-containing protein [Xylaria arbuscula]|nr:DNL zinc finger-domain-containing protein [Xylaria arbuscula]